MKIKTVLKNMLRSLAEVQRTSVIFDADNDSLEDFTRTVEYFNEINNLIIQIDDETDPNKCIDIYAKWYWNNSADAYVSVIYHLCSIENIDVDEDTWREAFEKVYEFQPRPVVF